MKFKKKTKQKIWNAANSCYLKRRGCKTLDTNVIRFSEGKEETLEILNCFHISIEQNVAAFIRGLAKAIGNGLSCFRHNDRCRLLVQI
jgi:hypothetical protein